MDSQLQEGAALAVTLKVVFQVFGPLQMELCTVDWSGKVMPPEH